MGNYPPYTLNNEILRLVASISTRLGQVLHYRDMSAYPRLRRNNRIESIHSSLAIEANSLTLGNVRDVIAGKVVAGPEREILEVKNAYAAYDELPHLNPYSLKELLRIHGIMTAGLVQEAGKFRHGEEGVFADGRCIFMAPPARLVPELMEVLFAWLGEAKKELQPLLLSSIFHYEFVFIHPFADGNGRMARLWQTALLSRWQPLFAYLPIENQIHRYQAEYYEAISRSYAAGESTPFITFMLQMIDAVLEELLQKDLLAEQDEYVKKLLAQMEYDVSYKAKELQEKLGLKSTAGLKRNYIEPAMRQGLIAMTLPDKPTSRNQRYYRVR
ncbi:Fic family protein [Selenomonas sp. AB3002]|uniref:Fic family protein n=1 Tax=Selenomonas sp. AB3002 TaxID=1392502 RepID=UPI000498389D